MARLNDQIVWYQFPTGGESYSSWPHPSECGFHPTFCSRHKIQGVKLLQCSANYPSPGAEADEILEVYFHNMAKFRIGFLC
jgi:hypothetical protein